MTTSKGNIVVEIIQVFLLQCVMSFFLFASVFMDNDVDDLHHHMEDWVSCSYIWSIFLWYFSMTKCLLTFMVGVSSPVTREKS